MGTDIEVEIDFGKEIETTVESESEIENGIEIGMETGLRLGGGEIVIGNDIREEGCRKVEATIEIDWVEIEAGLDLRRRSRPRRRLRRRLGLRLRVLR